MTTPPPLNLAEDISQTKLVLRNLLANYVVAGTELLIGLVMLPFNLAYLGKSEYGLWILVASVTVYFSIFDLGYGVAQVKFTAHYRAKGDRAALNQIASTMFGVFTVVGLLTYLIVILLAVNLEELLRLTPQQATTGRSVLLLIGAYVALGFPFSVFGGIVNGFQRMYLNGVVAVLTAVVVALVNVIVLLAGYGLVELVVATTSVRIISYFAYAVNAYRVFPELRIRLRSFQWSRLWEVTGFSVFVVLIDLANKLNYSTDTIVIGVFMGTAAVAIWVVAQRLIEIVQRITDQLNNVLFPVVVDSSALQHQEKLQKILFQGTRLSLAMVVPMAISLAVLAQPLVVTWVGPTFEGSVPVIYILSAAVALRVGNATSSMILKGSGKHKLLAASNIAMAVSNLVLSVLLVRYYGLIGVAFGTLIPMIVISLLITFPAACSRVMTTPFTLFYESVWPAIWPALIMAVFLLGLKTIFQPSSVFLLLQTALAVVIYAILFLMFAINHSERTWYFSKVRELLQSRTMLEPSRGLTISS